MSITSPNLNIAPSNADTNNSIIKGIFAPDVVISNLLNTGLKDLRANPWELNLVFNYMLDQPQLGEKERQRAINWFINNNIPVLWSFLLRTESFPCFTYTLDGGDLQELTLAFLNADTQENKKAEWEAITPKFTPIYTASTGIITIPPDIITNYHINETMVLVNYDGTNFSLTTLDISTGQFEVQANLVLDLKDCYIKNVDSRLSSNIESASFKDTIRVGVHSINDPTNAIWMFSICKYILLKYNKDLLEARGFECINMAYGPYIKDPVLPTENITTRFITLTGKVRDYWASSQTQRIGTVTTIPSYSPVDRETDLTLDVFGPEVNITDPGWQALLNADPTGSSM